MAITQSLSLMSILSIFVSACGSDSTPEDITRDYFERNKHVQVAFLNSRYDKSASNTKAYESIREKEWARNVSLLAPGFTGKPGDFDAHIWRRMYDHFKDNYSSMTADIGDPKTDGARSSVAVYFGSINRCIFSYSMNDNTWLISNIACTEYSQR